MYVQQFPHLRLRLCDAFIGKSFHVKYGSSNMTFIDVNPSIKSVSNSQPSSMHWVNLSSLCTMEVFLSLLLLSVLTVQETFCACPNNMTGIGMESGKEESEIIHQSPGLVKRKDFLGQMLNSGTFLPLFLLVKLRIEFKHWRRPKNALREAFTFWLY